MTLSTQSTLITAALATALTAFTALSFAQQTDTPPSELVALHMAHRADMKPMAPAERMAKMQEHRADGQARLKENLKITAEQEPAWNAFVARTAPTHRTAQTGEREDCSKLTTPQRLEKMQTRQAERAATITQRIDATRSFYATLTAEQQTAFDTQPHGFMRAGLGGKHRHGQGHRSGSGSGSGQDAPRQLRS